MQTWSVEKPAVRSEAGVVVSQHAQASAAGAVVLAEGGNAIDAAVTAALTVGVVEPWLSGLGGGGFMIAYDAASATAHALDFGMVAPARLQPSDYPLSPGGPTRGLFGWPNVVADRNLRGGSSICVPGAAAGFAAALERLGTISWRRALEPARAAAQAGLEVDWFTTLSIATSAADIATDPVSAARYLPGGVPPVPPLPPQRSSIAFNDLARTLDRLADAGADDLYRGDLAQELVRDLRAHGCAIDHADLANYRPVWHRPLERRVAGARVLAMPGLSGGPTLLHALAAIERAWGHDDVSRYRAIAQALTEAFAERFASMGAGHLAADAPSAEPEGCTTHVAVVDRYGNAVSLTNTLLARFGSMVTLPATGLLMNNGLMWFDPVPGRPNSIRAGARPLANMSPSVAIDADGRTWAVGAAGGRRIVPTVAQILAFGLLGGDSLEQAARRPRLDLSGASIGIDARLSADVRAALAHLGPVHDSSDAAFPSPFAVASCAAWEDGLATGVAHLGTPWAAACGA